MLDAVVVGGGPAGLSAATWLARYRCSTLVFDGGEPRNRWTEAAHGYLGFDPCTPADLLARGREQLLEYSRAAIRNGAVARIERTEQGTFRVEVDGEWLECKRIVLATGMADEFPEVDGFLEHYGASVFHCPACDGYEAKGKDAVVFGWGEQVAGFAVTLQNWARSVTVVTDGRALQEGDEHRVPLNERGIDVVEDDAVRLVGVRNDLQAVELRGGARLPCQIAFFTIAHHPRTALASQLGCTLDDEGLIVVTDGGRTSVPGVFAAGDCTPGTQLIQVAAAEGTRAGIACAMSLREPLRTASEL